MSELICNTCHPHHKHSDILLVALQYAGKLNVPKSTPIRELAEACSGWAGLDPQAELEWYEEIKFEPEVMCEALDSKTSCAQCQLEDGDILLFQASVPKVQSLLACRSQGTVCKTLQLCYNCWHHTPTQYLLAFTAGTAP